MTPGTNEKRCILGASELPTGRWLYHIAERATSVAFIEFLEPILDAYPTVPVIAIILDNVGTHSSRAVESWPPTHASACCMAPATLLITTRSSGSGAP